MEIIQQDQDTIAKPGTDGESHMAHDGNVSAKAQAGRSHPVCSEQHMVIEAVLSLTDFGRLCRQNNTTASTRIQRSRKSSEQHADRPDAIGLDHFIFFHDVATPAILGMSPSSHLRKKDEKSTADSPGYPLDSSHPSGVPHHNNRPRTPFQLDAFTIDRGPIITSASPFQQSLSFSPSNPLLLYHRPFSAGSNNASIPSSLNSTDYYSPSGSTHPSAVSALQPIPDNEQMFGMDMRHQRSPPFSRRPPTRSNSIVPQYTYNANGVSMFTAVTSAGPSTSFPSPKPFGMVQHINDTQEFPSDHPMPSPGLHMGYGNMFSFGGDSDNKDEEGVTFADRTVSTKVLSPVMQIEFLNVTMREAYL